MPTPNRIQWMDSGLPRIARSVLDVAASMQRREVVTIIDASNVPHTGVVNMIEAEAGDGRNFNIELMDKDVFHCRFA
jgi:hypothetical protein